MAELTAVVLPESPLGYRRMLAILFPGEYQGDMTTQFPSLLKDAPLSWYARLPCYTPPAVPGGYSGDIFVSRHLAYMLGWISTPLGSCNMLVYPADDADPRNALIYQESLRELEKGVNMEGVHFVVGTDKEYVSLSKTNTNHYGSISFNYIVRFADLSLGMQLTIEHMINSREREEIALCALEYLTRTWVMHPWMNNSEQIEIFNRCAEEALVPFSEIINHSSKSDTSMGAIQLVIERFSVVTKWRLNRIKKNALWRLAILLSRFIVICRDKIVPKHGSAPAGGPATILYKILYTVLNTCRREYSIAIPIGLEDFLTASFDSGSLLTLARFVESQCVNPIDVTHHHANLERLQLCNMVYKWVLEMQTDLKCQSYLYGLMADLLSVHETHLKAALIATVEMEMDPTKVGERQQSLNTIRKTDLRYKKFAYYSRLVSWHGSHSGDIFSYTAPPEVLVDLRLESSVAALSPPVVPPPLASTTVSASSLEIAQFAPSPVAAPPAVAITPLAPLPVTLIQSTTDVPIQATSSCIDNASCACPTEPVVVSAAERLAVSAATPLAISATEPVAVPTAGQRFLVDLRAHIAAGDMRVTDVIEYICTCSSLWDKKEYSNARAALTILYNLPNHLHDHPEVRENLRQLYDYMR